MRWQQQVADVTGELDTDRATELFPLGLPAYSAAVITVPRQSGKTTFIVPTCTYRAALWPLRSAPRSQLIRYAAQTRLDGMEKWNEHEKMLCESPWNSQFTTPRPGGREHMLWANGSMWGVMGVGKKSGHGPTLDLGVIDEAWAQEDFRLPQAMKPAMLTIQDSQLFTLSTMGTVKSILLNSLVADGRARVEAGYTSGVAYFEWSADDGADPADPATWLSCMPALGDLSLGYTQTIEKVQAEYDDLKKQPGEFERAFLNRATFITETIWPSLWWSECASLFDQNGDPLSLMNDPVCIGIDVSFDRSITSIGAAGRTSTGRLQIENVMTIDGTSSAVIEVQRICAKQNVSAVVIAADGPGRSLIPALEQLFRFEPHKLRIVTSTEMVAACGAMYDGIAQRRIVHIEQPELTAAQAGAAKRQIGDAWVLGRKLSEVDITPLVACTLAAWAVQFGGGYNGVAIL